MVLLIKKFFLCKLIIINVGITPLDFFSSGDNPGNPGNPVCIGSNCPGISGTVPDLLTLSLVPEGLPICPGRSLISS